MTIKLIGDTGVVYEVRAPTYLIESSYMYTVSAKFWVLLTNIKVNIPTMAYYLSVCKIQITSMKCAVARGTRMRLLPVFGTVKLTPKVC